ncbi:OLC1v1010369C1 [Oldenlandia corymbosa var. corymbosa]|uniref:OLC1v1010369C1 n=1 Tax=Oldenlandia corymbosa var. corymbosa TaxID=529605 RepID=A0AAV1DR77_OLDCO|nr:OLC1v1010369C1 [Oldenlandia corymbosa var. corymbosa]
MCCIDDGSVKLEPNDPGGIICPINIASVDEFVYYDDYDASIPLSGNYIIRDMVKSDDVLDLFGELSEAVIRPACSGVRMVNLNGLIRACSTSVGSRCSDTFLNSSITINDGFIFAINPRGLEYPVDVFCAFKDYNDILVICINLGVKVTSQNESENGEFTFDPCFLFDVNSGSYEFLNSLVGANVCWLFEFVQEGLKGHYDALCVTCELLDLLKCGGALGTLFARNASNINGLDNNEVLVVLTMMVDSCLIFKEETHECHVRTAKLHILVASLGDNFANTVAFAVAVEYSDDVLPSDCPCACGNPGYIRYGWTRTEQKEGSAHVYVGGLEQLIPWR